MAEDRHLSIDYKDYPPRVRYTVYELALVINSFGG